MPRANQPTREAPHGAQLPPELRDPKLLAEAGLEPKSLEEMGADEEPAAGIGQPMGQEPAAAPMKRVMVRDMPQAMTKERIHEAMQTLQEYKAGKAMLEQRVIENERWYKMRHWECLRKKAKPDDVEPSSGWLFNALANKHADAMDNFPSPNILPREEGDKQEAEMLSSIIPVVLDQGDFEQVYDDVQSYKLETGTGIYGIFWDGEKHNGLGDIVYKKMDILNLFWESGISDIQDSRNVFSVELRDNDLLEQQYPQLKEKLSAPTVALAQYVQDDTIDTTKKSAVIDWYYKKYQNGKTVLHYCKFVNDVVLFSTENDPQYQERGWYDHGMYPFVFDPLFRSPGSPCGFGYIDVGKNAQEYIDRGNKAILQNMLANARPRHFIRKDGAVNEAEYADVSKDFIHVDGNLGQDSILPVTTNPLGGIYVQVVNDKINELKEVTGNRDISTGGTTAGVTAASAIAAMQEAGSKLSRDNNKSSYRAFRKVILMTIELIRQFYDQPRQFRIIGQGGVEKFVAYDNAGIAPQDQGRDFGIDMGTRVPVFDVEVTAQKQSPYSKMSQNELALQFYGAGFFAPQNADAALACLDMMDFDRKSFVTKKIQQNMTLLQMVQMLQQQVLGMAQQLDAMQGSNLTQQAMAQMGMAVPGMGAGPMEGGPVMPPEDVGNEESSVTKNARERVADSTAPT